MANYNYVAPIQYKSYSDMNKERLAAKAAQDAAKAKSLSAGDKQRQGYLDQLSGLSTKGWASAYRDELGVIVKNATAQLSGPDGANVSWSPIADAIMRVTDIAELHRDNASAGRDQYEAYMDPESGDPEGNTWDNEVIYDLAGFEQRRDIYNSVGLIGYSAETGMGMFPNNDWKPGDPEDHKTMKGFLLSEEGAQDGGIQNGVETVIINGEVVEVSGKPSDVQSGGFGGLWNGDIKPRDTITPDNAFVNFEATGGGKSLFTTLANTYKGQVTGGELTADQAYNNLVGDVLTYLTGQNPNLSLQKSAIKMWEEEFQMSWTTMDAHNTRTQDPDATAAVSATPTPWDMYAEAVADYANLKPKPSKSGSDTWTAQTDLWMVVQDVNSYEGIDNATTGIVTDDSALAKSQWDKMLGVNLGGDFGGQVSGANIQYIVKEINESDSPQLNITVPQGKIKYDGQYIDRVTYNPEEDYMFIWKTDPDQGEQGPLPEDSNWAWTEVGLGSEKGLSFQVIYKWKDGKQPTYNSDGEINNGAELTQQYRALRATFKLKMPEDISGTADPLKFLLDKAATEAQ